MSRYGNKFKDDLYDEMVARYESSHLELTEFVALLLEMISDLVRSYTWSGKD